MKKPASKDHAAQEQLLPFLLNPRSYPHRPRAVRLVQTHASFVFLAPHFVFKVKKAVNFGFLNFSTLDRRRYYCEREVELNRRLCPDVYLGVVPIGKHAGRHTFGKGKVVEYAVQMRLLPDRDFLKNRLQRSPLPRAIVRRIVSRLKLFYEAHPPTRAITNWGRVSRLRISTDENFRQTKPFIGQALSRPAFEAIRRFTNGFYRRHARLFASRLRQGRIRDCHGDLHCGHIHLAPRRLNIIDCVEFNDRLRYVDVASDAAFLAMDLDHCGRPDLAQQFVRSLASELGDPGLVELMDFYKCYRAFVRGKVECLHSTVRIIGARERNDCLEQARRYFQQALRYAIAGSQPAVLVVMGGVASGKSSLAAGLSRELGWPVHSSDRIRKTLAGVPLLKRLNAEGRRFLYSEAMTRKTYSALGAAARLSVRSGTGAILDATFGRRELRDEMLRLLTKGGAVVRFIQAQASDAVRRRRLAGRSTGRREISDARLEDFAALTAGYEPPCGIGQEKPIISDSEVPTERQLARVLENLVLKGSHLDAVRE
jgi:aminoglycoside phosphotransferase family enzyme/predicted kinase